MSEKPNCKGVELQARNLKNAESNRKQMELEYRVIVRTAMDGFLLVDRQGSILEVNDAYCDLIGYSRDELRVCKFLISKPVRNRRQLQLVSQR